jgi:hypothetical protein
MACHADRAIVAKLKGYKLSSRAFAAQLTPLARVLSSIVLTFATLYRARGHVPTAIGGRLNTGATRRTAIPTHHGQAHRLAGEQRKAPQPTGHVRCKNIRLSSYVANPLAGVEISGRMVTDMSVYT